MKSQHIKNKFTNLVLTKPTPIDEEVEYDGRAMITETDTAGIVTFANRKFIEMTGYTKEELIGSPHNINRHPDMPSIAFKDMWKLLKNGKYWQGIVKNLRKDGRHYWVDVWIQAKYDDNDKLIGYIAGRRVPQKGDIAKYETLYAEMLEKELHPSDVEDDFKEEKPINIDDVIQQLEHEKEFHLTCISSANLLINKFEVSINNVSIKSSHCAFAKWVYGEAQRLRSLYIDLEALSTIEALHNELHILYSHICKTFNEKNETEVNEAERIIAEGHYQKLLSVSKTLFEEIDAFEKELMKVKVA